MKLNRESWILESQSNNLSWLLKKVYAWVRIAEKNIQEKKLMGACCAFNKKVLPFAGLSCIYQGCAPQLTMCQPPSTVTVTDNPQPCFQLRRITRKCCRVSCGHWKGNCWTLTRHDWNRRITSTEEVRRTCNTTYLPRAAEEIKQQTATPFLFFPPMASFMYTLGSCEK